MAQVTGMTATKINSELDAALVSGTIDDVTGVLTLQTRGGQTITAGNVDTVAAAVDAAYPIGSIFMTTVSSNPSVQLGVGTWVAWGTGQVPVGVDPSQTEFDTVEKTGGSKTHTITLAQIPRHNHSGAPHTHAIDHKHNSTANDGAHRHTINMTSSGGSVFSVAEGQGSGYADYVNPIQSTSSNHSHAIPDFVGTSGPASNGTTGNSGGNTDGTTQPHNNLQPYITCYMWKRTG